VATNQLLLLSLILSLILIISIPSIDAAKSHGTHNQKTNLKTICGDKLCDDIVSIEEKIGNYMAQMFGKSSGDTAFQQSRFMMGGVSQQQHGAGTDTISFDRQNYSPGDTVNIKGKIPNAKYLALEAKINGQSILARTVEPDKSGTYNFSFKIPQSSKLGTLEILASSSIGGKPTLHSNVIEISDKDKDIILPTRPDIKPGKDIQDNKDKPDKDTKQDISTSDPNTIRGANYAKKETVQPDGTVKGTIILGLPEYIQDNSGKYVPHIVEQKGKWITIESGQISLEVDKNDCTARFYEPGKIRNSNPMVEKHFWSVSATESGKNSWSDVRLQGRCNVSIEESDDSVTITVIVQDAKGKLETKYVKKAGGALETVASFTNLDDKKTNHVFGLTENAVGLYNMITGDSEPMAQDLVEPIKTMKIKSDSRSVADQKSKQHSRTLVYDFEIEQDKLSNFKFDNINGKTAAIAEFKNMAVLHPGQTVTVDPQWSVSSGVWNTVMAGGSGTASCPTTATAINPDLSPVITRHLIRQPSHTWGCVTGSFTFDTSTIPDSAEITDTVLVYGVSAVGSPRTCDFTAMGVNPNDPSTTPQQMWDDIVGGTRYATNDSSCTTVSSDKVLDLGAQADANLQDSLQSDVFSVGMPYTDMSRDADYHWVIFDQHQLEVEYVDRPDVAVGEIQISTWDGDLYGAIQNSIHVAIMNSHLTANNVDIAIQLYFPLEDTNDIRLSSSTYNGPLSSFSFCNYDSLQLLIQCTLPQFGNYEIVNFNFNMVLPLVSQPTPETQIVDVNVSAPSEADTSNNSKTFSAPILPLIETDYEVSLSNIPSNILLGQKYTINYSFSIPYSSADTYLPYRIISFDSNFYILDTSVSSRSSNNLTFLCVELVCRPYSNISKHPQGTFIEGTITIGLKPTISKGDGDVYWGSWNPPDYPVISNEDEQSAKVYYFFGRSVAPPGPAVAEMHWYSHEYLSNTNPKIRIIEPDMNISNTSQDIMHVRIFTESITGLRVPLPLIETTHGSGIFEGTLCLVLSNTCTTIFPLPPLKEELLFASYIDNTLPFSSPPSLEVTASTQIRIPEPIQPEPEPARPLPTLPHNPYKNADFNKDGYSDLAVGVPSYSSYSVANSGEVFIFSGANSQSYALFYHSICTVDSKVFDFFGYSLTTGDFDKNGYSDLVIGVPYKDIGNREDAGTVYIMYGSPTGSYCQELNQNTEGIEGESEAYDFFGESLIAGDFNGDGYSDLAIGVPNEDLVNNTVSDAGMVHIIYGSANGLTAAGSSVFRQNTEGIEGTPETRDNFGKSLTAGDFNGDQKSDLAIGVPNEDIGNISDAGMVHIIYGSQDGLTTINSKSILEERWKYGTGIIPNQFGHTLPNFSDTQR